jgi:hypothetical protein
MTGAHTSTTGGTQKHVNAINNPHSKKAHCTLFLAGYEIMKTCKGENVHPLSKLT